MDMYTKKVKFLLIISAIVALFLFDMSYAGTKETVKAYQNAASQGDAQAQYNLGNMHRAGYGVKQDYYKASEWYKRAANQGDASAQYLLGVTYENGFGVNQDYYKAFEWYQKAAKQGNTDAHNAARKLINYGLVK